MPRIDLAPLPPAEAVRFFRSKGYRIGFAWQDVWQEEHARAFTVAKATRLDLLQDIRAAVDAAIADGKTLAQFRAELKPVLRRQGWWGRKRVTDPLTGEETLAQLGSPRRLKTIFNTNLRTAYAAGAWERAQRLKARRPFLRYVQLDRPSKREAHTAWHGTVLPMGHAFWNTHYPPNGWYCGCTVQQLSRRDLDRFGFRVSAKAPAVRRRPWRNRRTGRVVRVPEGIDPGFGYNVGKAHLRGLTPPPRSGPLRRPFIGPPAEVEMPAPRDQPASRLLPAGLSEEDYLERFLAEFGAASGKPVVFTDKVGEPVAIGADLFAMPDGRIKVTKRGRERTLLLLADTIKDPDEIWWRWEEFPKGKTQLLRRYVARWRVEGRKVDAITVFEVGRDGWSGVTAFPADREAYLRRQRGGTLAYRRP